MYRIPLPEEIAPYLSLVVLTHAEIPPSLDGLGKEGDSYLRVSTSHVGTQTVNLGSGVGLEESQTWIKAVVVALLSGYRQGICEGSVVGSAFLAAFPNLATPDFLPDSLG